MVCKKTKVQSCWIVIERQTGNTIIVLCNTSWPVGTTDITTEIMVGHTLSVCPVGLMENNLYKRRRCRAYVGLGSTPSDVDVSIRVAAN